MYYQIQHQKANMNLSTHGIDRKDDPKIESMVEIEFHLGCKKSDGRRAAIVMTGSRTAPLL